MEKTCGHNLLDWSFQPVVVNVPLCFLLLAGRWRRELDGYHVQFHVGAGTEEALSRWEGLHEQGRSL